MSKRNNDGDVIANRISLLEAKGQKLLASLYGSRPDWDSVGSAAKTQNDDDDQDLKQNYAHDRIGLGGVLPKDIEDGSFTKRIPTSDDKLLQQLIGKRKAKAHIAAKQEAARSKPATKAQQYAKQNVAKKEESDEEEGRAATFKSKRQKKKEKQAPRKVVSDDEDEESRTKRLAANANNEDETKENVIADTQVDVEPTQDDDEEAEVAQPAPQRTKTKPKSFLDEILAERSKKKADKGK
ncbi:DUF3245 containing protein [Pyrenophora tritici-repentis]|uniref:DUF3245 containing protein n=2 Tax=Pyrenophora tritici-repentis TaxID=45151 RepID=A0A922SUS5_9PLEO|nr:uncharacterized protein PTRG_08517 [Pyrenophora tritici-repentis Pt-1C-BFP]EDU51436.1 predicted protein [Pyrenophora tritici-repentis Pt-1C-BFP]KAI1519341.1 DUF3245 containing protein [Pyrenophora tritici-repentis]KAI1666211.1 DUF3245 containing protein [Pyrenophora tritici-repentis]KAI1679205.1 DUF3245 containing protein [Pyrenophora tritici-repentis]